VQAVQRAVWGFAPSLDAAFAPALRCAQLALSGCSRPGGAFASTGLVQEAARFGAELYYILYMGFTSALNRWRSDHATTSFCDDRF
jgi:NaMN:DMB phosphoribosyltransferase